jgi:hypothetical protein
MATATVNKPQYQTPLVLTNRIVAPEWLRWFNQLKLSSDNSDTNAAAIAALEHDLGETNTRVASLEGRMTAAESNITILQSNVGTLQVQVGGLQIRVNQNSLAITDLDARVEALETYKTVWPIKTVSADYTVVYGDFTVDVDASAGAITITLPAAGSLVTGEYHNVKKTDSTLHIVTIDGNGQLIDGDASVRLLLPGWSLGLQFDGAAWSIL